MGNKITNLKEYYKTTELFLPYKSEWRYFLFLLPNRNMKRFHIKNKKELRKLLVKFLPIKVYFSSGAWLNVRNIRGRKNNNYPIKIFEDVIFDIDSKTISDAKKSALEIINRIGVPNNIIKTTRGFHLWYLQRKNRKELIREVRDIRDVDIHCTENEFNVYALPLTIKNGEICRFVGLEELNIPFNNEEGFESSERNNDQAETHLNSVESGKIQSKIDLGNMPSNPSNSPVHSINNQVKKGVFIPILIYEKSYKGLKKELDNLNRLYSLGDIYGFESEKYYAFISLRCFEKRQLQKLLNISNSLNKRQFKKFGKIWFDISEFQLIGVCRYKINKYFRGSRKHFNYFINCGVKPIMVDELVGHPQLQTYEVYKE